MGKCFIEFEITDEKRFLILQQVVTHFMMDKEQEKRSSAEDWHLFFDEQALSHFWWPTEQECEEHWGRWNSMSIEQRRNDGLLNSHPWHFESMLDAIYDAEYYLLGCEKVAEGQGHLEYTCLYGSSKALEALVKAFECNVTGMR